MPNELFGFSTGALEKNDYQCALGWLTKHNVHCIELSALRFEELEPLVNNLDHLETSSFRYISFHAPSSFSVDQEDRVVGLLEAVFRRGWNIIVHPDVIYTPEKWRKFQHHLLIENMDRRKRIGRTSTELRQLLALLPEAMLCLDVAHARQLDTTLTLLWSIITTFRGRIAEIHMSELDSRCRHLPLSHQAVLDYRRFAERLQNIPVIIESMLYHCDSETREQEVVWAERALGEEAQSVSRERLKFN